MDMQVAFCVLLIAFISVVGGK